MIQLAHHMILYLPVAEWAGISFSANCFFVVPGILIVLVNLHAISIILGIICARFRDVAQIVASVLQLLMFMTPVFWFPDNLPARAKFVLMNPLAQMMDVIRLPLLGAAPAPGTWWFLGILTVLNVTLAAILYTRFRRTLVFWI